MIRSWLGVQQKAAGAPPLVVFVGSSASGTGDWSYKRLATEGYRNNPVVAKCVRDIAVACASIPTNIYRRVRGDDGGYDWEVDTAHEAEETWMKRPNPWQSWEDWVRSLISYKMICGNAYCLMVGPSENAPPRELHWLPPDSVTIEYSKDPMEPVAFYLVKTPSGQVRHLPSEVIHFREWNPLEPPYGPGMPRLAHAALSIDANNEARVWNTAMLRNGMRPPGVLTVNGTLSPEQRESLKERLQQYHAGSMNVDRPMVLEGGEMTWTPTGGLQKDADWLDGMNLSAREIANAIGYPPELLGDSDLTTYSNRQDARKALYSETIIPELAYIEGEINAKLMPLYGPEYEFRFDRDIDVLSEEQDKVWARVAGASFLSENEKREELQLGPREDLEGVHLVPSNLVDLREVMGEETGSVYFPPLETPVDAEEEPEQEPEDDSGEEESSE